MVGGGGGVRLRLCVRVCVCVCVRATVRVHVCQCVRYRGWVGGGRWGKGVRNAKSASTNYFLTLTK